MSSDGSIFGFGVVIASLAWIIILTVIQYKETSGYSDKMTITYHCVEQMHNDKQYRLFWNMLENSGVQTNFVNKEVKFDRHNIRVRMTNPVMAD